MIDLEKDCELIILSETQVISSFNCGNSDLNDFFNHDALLYRRQMLSETCFYRHKISGDIICAFSFSASSIKTADLPGSRRKKVKELDSIKKITLTQYFQPKNRKKKHIDNILPKYCKQDICFTI